MFTRRVSKKRKCNPASIGGNKIGTEALLLISRTVQFQDRRNN